MFLSDNSVIALATGIIASQAHDRLNSACTHTISAIFHGNSQFPPQLRYYSFLPSEMHLPMLSSLSVKLQFELFCEIILQVELVS